MIYVSSSCIKSTTIGEAVHALAEAGYTCIELSGGTRPYPEMLDDLFRLKSEFGLNYLCHNYFPPPQKDFVLNLASLDDEINRMSLEHVIDALHLSEKLDADKFAFHAGFLINIPLSQVGRTIEKTELFDRSQARTRFNENLARIRAEARNIGIYVENNVLSINNYESYGQVNPFFVTDSSGLQEFEITPLLDVAHLKVSCQTLGLDFTTQMDAFFDRTDYVHISDNNGAVDNNQGLKAQSELYNHLAARNWAGKTVTIEVYSGAEDLKESYDNVLSIIDGSRQ